MIGRRDIVRIQVRACFILNTEYFSPMDSEAARGIHTRREADTEYLMGTRVPAAALGLYPRPTGPLSEHRLHLRYSAAESRKLRLLVPSVRGWTIEGEDER